MYKEILSKYIKEIRRSKNNIITDSSPKSDTKLSGIEQNIQYNTNDSNNKDVKNENFNRKRIQHLSTKQKINRLLRDDSETIKQLSASMKNPNSKNDNSFLGRKVSKGLELKMNYEVINEKYSSDIRNREILNEAELLEHEVYEKSHTLENEYETEELFRKLQFEEFMLAFWTLLSIGTSLVYYSIRENFSISLRKFETDSEAAALDSKLTAPDSNEMQKNILQYERAIIILLSLSTIATLFFETFYSSGLLKYLIAEIIAAFFHPNALCHSNLLSNNKDYHYVLNREWNLQDTFFNENDFFIVASLFRIYIILRWILCLSEYYSPRSNRITKMTGSRLDLIFALKCFMLNKPIICVVVIGGCSSFAFSFMLNIIEGPVYYINQSSQENLLDYRNFSNCFWNVVVTMTTVGYGDMYPKSTYGRTVTVMSSITGIILSTFLMVGLQGTFRLEAHEQTVYDFVTRINAKTETKHLAADYFIAGYKYSKAKQNFRKVKEEKKSSLEREVCYEILKETLVQKNRVKKDYKNSLHNFRNTYDGPCDYDPVDDKIDELEKQIGEITEFHANLLNKMNILSEKLEEEEDV